MSIFGGPGGPDPFEGGLFGGGGGRDPFKEFGGFGADPFGGSVMKRFDDMTRDMVGGFGGLGAMAAGSGGRGGGGGSYTCQTFAMSSVMGPDGKMHTERFCSSDVGNREHGVREAQQAYSNSRTGVDKMGMERQLGDRARKMVKERDRNTMEERSTEMFRGMDESGRQAFDRDFVGKAGYMPQHQRFNPAMLQGAPAGARGGQLADSAYGGGQVQRHRSTPGGRRR